MLCPWQQRTKIDAPGFSPVLLPRSSYLQEVPAFWGFFYNMPWVSSGWRKTCYQLILEVLSTDVLLAKPNQIICLLGRFLCTFVQGMNGKMMGWAGQGSAGTEGQGSRCLLRSRGAARQQERPAVTQKPPVPLWYTWPKLPASIQQTSCRAHLSFQLLPFLVGLEG